MNSKRSIFLVIVIIVVISSIVVPTFSIYTKTIDEGLSGTITGSATPQKDPYEDHIGVIEWFLNELDPSSDQKTVFNKGSGGTDTLYNYMYGLNKAEATINSLGKNYGIPITEKMFTLGIIDTTICSWQISKIKEAGLYYIVIYFTFTDLTSLSNGDVVSDILCYNESPQSEYVWTFGSATVTSAKDGMNGAANSINSSEYVVQGVIEGMNKDDDENQKVIMIDDSPIKDKLLLGMKVALWLMDQCVEDSVNPKYNGYTSNGTKFTIYSYWTNDCKNKSSSITCLGVNYGQPIMGLLVDSGLIPNKESCQWFFEKALFSGTVTYSLCFTDEDLTQYNVGERVSDVVRCSFNESSGFVWSLGSCSVTTASNGNNKLVNTFTSLTFEKTATIDYANYIEDFDITQYQIVQ